MRAKEYLVEAVGILEKKITFPTLNLIFKNCFDFYAG